MNSKQRRNAYRAMPKPGEKIAYRTSKRVLIATVIGRANPSSMYNGFGMKPSVFRVRARIDDSDESTIQPLLSVIEMVSAS